MALESNYPSCGSPFAPEKASITAFIAALQAVAPMDATIPHPRVSGRDMRGRKLRPDRDQECRHEGRGRADKVAF